MLNTLRTAWRLLALGAACFQQPPMAMVLAQTTTSAPAPLPPASQNTLGLSVVSPINGMAVYINTPLIFSASIPGKMLSSAWITVAKADGSSNSTIVDVKGVSSPRLFQVVNITEAEFPVGDYYLQMIITPGSSSVSSTVPIGAATTTAAVAPTLRPGVVGTQTNIYYWRGLIRIQEGSSSSKSKSAAPTMIMQAGAFVVLQKMGIALGALALGCVFTL